MLWLFVKKLCPLLVTVTHKCDIRDTFKCQHWIRSTCALCHRWTFVYELCLTDLRIKVKEPQWVPSLIFINSSSCSTVPGSPAGVALLWVANIRIAFIKHWTISCWDWIIIGCCTQERCPRLGAGAVPVRHTGDRTPDWNFEGNPWGSAVPLAWLAAVAAVATVASGSRVQREPPPPEGAVPAPHPGLQWQEPRPLITH